MRMTVRTHSAPLGGIGHGEGGTGGGRGAAVPGRGGAVAAAYEPAGPLPLRLLPAALRAALGLPELRRALDDRADVRHRERHLPELRRFDAGPDLSQPRARPPPGSR